MYTEFVADVTAFSEGGDFTGDFQVRIPTSSPASYTITGNESMTQGPQNGDGDAAYCSSPRSNIFSRGQLFRNPLLEYPPLSDEAGESLIPSSPHFGMVTCILPLAKNDVLVAGGTAFGRITAGTIVWRVSFTATENLIPTCVGLQGANAVFIYSDFYQSQARAFTSAISRSNGTQDPNAVTVYSALDETVLLDGAHLLPHVLPGFEVAVDHAAMWFEEYDGTPPGILIGPANDNGGGSMTVAGPGCGTDGDGGDGFGAVSRTSVLSSTTFTSVNRLFSVQVSEAAFRALLPPLPPGFDFYSLQWTATFMNFNAPPTPEATEFWTHLFNATETI